MGDPKPYSRMQTRKHLRAWLSRERWGVAGLAAMLGVLLAIEAALLRFLMPGSYGIVVGVLTGMVIVGICWAIHVAFLAHEGAGIRHLRGAVGETSTRDVLKRARRRRQVWGVVNGLATQRGDIDHIVVSRNGGLVVIDSKFRTGLTPGDRQSIIEAGRDHRRSMQGLARTIVPRGHGRHRGQEHLPVTTAIVLWGPARHELAEPQVVDGVHVMSGDHLYAWLKTLDGEPIPKSFGRELTEKIHEWAERQRERAAAKANEFAGS